MLHFCKAGFECDMYAPGGRPAQFEMWAFPEKDNAVKNLFDRYKTKFENPTDLSNFSLNANQYVAVFIPGGHGASNGLPFNAEVKKILQWAIEKKNYLLNLPRTCRPAVSST